MNFFEQFFNQDFISEYNHANYIDTVNGKRFFHMDCSGFLYWCLFQMGYIRALAELRSFLKKNNFIKINRMYCKDFAFIYENKKDFKYWNFLSEPTKECILIVVFPGGAGHCMFIDEIIDNNKNNLHLRIIDSTQYPHDNDTRNKNATGIGIGDIKLVCDHGNWFYDACNPNLPTRQADVYFVSPMKQRVN